MLRDSSIPRYGHIVFEDKDIVIIAYYISEESNNTWSIEGYGKERTGCLWSLTCFLLLAGPNGMGTENIGKAEFDKTTIELFKALTYISFERLKIKLR